METLNKIIELLKQKNKTQKDLTDYLGLSKYIFSDWKSAKSNSYLKYISKIAEFLNVSADYLLGTEQKEKSLSSEQDKLLSMYNSLGEEGKAMLLQQARILLKAKE